MYFFPLRVDEHISWGAYYWERVYNPQFMSITSWDNLMSYQHKLD